mmetsp:Transcript_85763/g.199334  ORF Transcript_85763/g.199334 Transcript_85763/m.199334 type:complete len:246 (-) Transcript_85763:1152-1889(-)
MPELHPELWLRTVPFDFQAPSALEAPPGGQQQLIVAANREELLPLQELELGTALLAELRAVNGHALGFLVEVQHGAYRVQPLLSGPQIDAEDCAVHLHVALACGLLLLVAGHHQIICLRLLEARLRVREHRGQHSVHHDVGVSPDGRSEVRVVVEIQREVVRVYVAVVHKVLSLAHAAAHDHELHAEAQRAPIHLVDGLTGTVELPSVVVLPVYAEVVAEHLLQRLGLAPMRERMVPQHRDLRER